MSSVTNDPMCVSPNVLEMYHSSLYTAAVLFNLTLAIGSIVLIVLAVRELLMESIITISTRMFLIVGLMCCTLHQTCYIALRIQILYQTFFKLDEPCDFYYRAFECKPVTFGLVSGNTGMAVIQLAMTIDRIAVTTMPRFWPKLKYWPGIVMSAMVIIGNYFLNMFIFWTEPFTESVVNCGTFPSTSQSRFLLVLKIAFYLSIGHMLINTVLLYINGLQERRQRFVTDDQRNSFNVNERYQSRETLKSTQAIFFLAMSQFFAMLLYTAITQTFLSLLRPVLSDLNYALVIALLYTTPYACLAIPSLIILTLHFIKKQRMRSINTMTAQKETGDEHMKKIQQLWDK